VYQTSFGQVVLTLSRFFGQDVAFESVFPFDFAGSCKGKPLFCTGFGFYFWHFAVFKLVEITFYLPSER
jgi:hypothetical protein